MTKKIDFVSIILMTLLGSYYFEIVAVLFALPIIDYMAYVKLGIGVVIIIFNIIMKNESYIKFSWIILSTILLFEVSKWLMSSAFFIDQFNTNEFWVLFASNVIPKFIVALIFSAFLVLLFKNRSSAYLCVGDLNAMATRIDFLGIKDNQINWMRLSLISGLLIGFGTLALTIITTIGTVTKFDVGLAMNVFPSIILLALMNSFSEGIFFRSAIIAGLNEVLPKSPTLIISAVIFGSYHYHGSPGGIIGVIMSTLLGWYIARSVYETKGLFCGWIIHFCQDVVIFTAIALMR